MRVRLASAAAPGKAVNEDHAFAHGGLAGVLDGVTAPAGLDTGCVHGVAWYAGRLAHRLAAADPRRPLAEALHDAVDAVRADHGGACDLGHPGTPAATVCLLRDAGDRAEFLLLGDSPLVLDDGVLVDDRFDLAVADLRAEIMADPAAIGTPAHAAHVRSVVTRQRERVNRAGGYWIAAATPEAAAHAVTGTRALDGTLRRAALMSDGAYGPLAGAAHDPRALLDLVAAQGPAALVRRIHTGPGERRGYKTYDDASIVDCRFA